MKILAFGIAKEIVGGPGVEVSLAGEKSVGSLRSFLNNKYPRLQQLSSYLIAINDEYASEEATITDWDEIAIIPPVSGG